MFQLLGSFRRPPTGDLVSRLVLSHSEDLAVITRPQSQMDGFIRAPVVVGGREGGAVCQASIYLEEGAWSNSRLSVGGNQKYPHRYGASPEPRA